MGQTFSWDFRKVVDELIKNEVTETDSEQWKVFFLTDLSAVEISTNFAPWDVRRIRREKPQNLVVVIRQCLKQIIGFIERTTTLSSGASTSTSELDSCIVSNKDTEDFDPASGAVVDANAVRNAVRILAGIMPFVLEPELIEGSEPDAGGKRSSDPVYQAKIDRERRAAKEAYLKKPPSPFAHNFAEYVLWNNCLCLPCDAAKVVKVSNTDGEDASERAAKIAQASASMSTFPPMMQCHRGSGTKTPLAVEIVQLLTQLAFIPGYTLDSDGQLPTDAATKPSMVLATADGRPLPFKIYPQLLHCVGLYKDQSALKLSFSQDAMLHRYEVLRALISCFTVSCATGFPRERNRMLEIFGDATQNPLGATLCVGCINYASNYVSRGIMPFSSHYWAELPEAHLAECLELLMVCMDFPVGAMPFDKINPQQTMDMYYSRQNAFWAVFSAVMSAPTTASFVVDGLLKIIDNPLYAMNTVFKGSQRIVQCVSEALAVLWKLLCSPTTASSTVKALVPRLRTSLHSLLFFVQLGKADKKHFGDLQVVMFILMRLSTEEEFLKCLSLPLEGSDYIPIDGLPDCKTGTLADILVLSLCDCMCPNSPKWLQPLLNGCAIVLANIAPRVNLLEVTCFETYHLFDFVVSDNVLLKNRKSVDPNALLSCVCDFVAKYGSYQPTAAIPLIASLSTGTVVDRLLHFAENGTCGTSADSVDMAAASAVKVDDELHTVGAAEGHAEESAVEMKTAPAKRPSPRPLTPEFKATLPLAALREINKVSHECVTAIEASAPGAADPYTELKAFLTSSKFQNVPPKTLREFELTEDVIDYTLVVQWHTIWRHNMSPMLLDRRTVKLF